MATILLAALAILGAPPAIRATAVITGPTTASPGDLVILDASTSDAAAFTWALPGSTKTILAVDGGRRCVFASGASGKYVFVLATAKADAVAIATHELTIGTPPPPPGPEPGPGPTPPPAPVLPDGKFKLAARAYAEALKVATANRPAEALKMAASFRVVAASIAAGTTATPKAILDQTADAIKTNLGDRRDAWKPWGATLGAEYQRLMTAGQLSSPADWGAAWSEVADGLEAIK